MRAVRALALSLIAVLMCVGCYSGPVATTAPASLVEKLEDETVALVKRDADGTHQDFCSAVWVGSYRLLTAAHCVTGDEVPTVFVEYTTQRESRGLGQEPKAVHTGLVFKIDVDHDLASIYTGNDTPIHSSASLALVTPRVGDGLHFVGHPSGLVWTYVHGYAAAYRADLFGLEPGPWLQVSAPIWFGNSGGGAFDTAGDLVGIASRKAGAPSVGFYVHLDTIRSFLR